MKMPQMSCVRKFVVNHLWWVVLVAAVSLFAAHTFGLRPIVVDNTSLILLVLILVSPFVAAIKKIKIGEFEAEIEPEEVRRITEEVQRSLPSAPADAATAARSVTLMSAIKNLADTDP